MSTLLELKCPVVLVADGDSCHIKIILVYVNLKL